MSTSHPSRSRMAAGSLIACLALSGTFLTACGSNQNDEASAPASAVVTHDHAAEAGLQTAMRTLWLQHMEWTWSTVNAFVLETPSLKADLDRLLANQKDIGDAVAAYYGEDAGRQLTKLLTTHIEQAVPVLTAAKAGDQGALAKAVKDWYGNAQDIADFLAKANPDNWSQAEMRPMMKGHIDQTIAYASAVIGGKHAAAVRKYDAAEEHMVHMADMLAAGIIAQFPDKI